MRTMINEYFKSVWSCVDSDDGQHHSELLRMDMPCERSTSMHYGAREIILSNTRPSGHDRWLDKCQALLNALDHNCLVA